jgi:iron complex transport system substrate-binding protein
MVKDYVPHFSRATRTTRASHLGAIVQPNLERVHALKPDLMLITSMQANHYQELSQIAPTMHFDVDYRTARASTST